MLGNICLAQYQLKDYQGALQSINEAIDCFPTRFKVRQIDRDGET